MKVLCIIEKTSQKIPLLEFLEKQNFKAKTIDVKVIKNHVFHFNDEFVPLRKKDNKYFCRREDMNLKALSLENLLFPEDTYLVQNIEEDNINDIYDLIICVADHDELGILSMANYLEKHNISSAKYLDTLFIYDSNIKEENYLKDFSCIYKNIKQKILMDNYASPYPRKYDVLALREKSGMNRTEFSKYFEIPYRTVENWEFDINICPKYLYELLKFKLITDGKIVDKK